MIIFQNRPRQRRNPYSGAGYEAARTRQTRQRRNPYSGTGG